MFGNGRCVCHSLDVRIGMLSKDGRSTTPRRAGPLPFSRARMCAREPADVRKHVLLRHTHAQTVQNAQSNAVTASCCSAGARAGARAAALHSKTPHLPTTGVCSAGLYACCSAGGAPKQKIIFAPSPLPSFPTKSPWRRPWQTWAQS